MSSIDWSDPDEMLGLLLEYVADEERTAFQDDDRAEFLRGLSGELDRLAGREFVAVDQIAEAIREIRDAQPREFLNDEVITHLDACIEELHRIGSPGARANAG
jgi:nicotinamide riboside kinase